MTTLDDTTDRQRQIVMPKRSWVTLAVIEVLAILHSIFGLVAGLPNGRLMEMMGYPNGATVPQDFETALAAITRLGAMSTLAFALLALAVTLVPYRRGERWAWTALWIFPGLYLVEFFADMVQFGDGFPEDGTLGVVFLYYVVPSVVGLLLGISTIRRRAH
jgi:hypothetical protein